MGIYYQNYLYVRGNKKEIAKLKRKSHGKDGKGFIFPFWFENYESIPPELLEEDDWEKLREWVGSSECKFAEASMVVDKKRKLGYFIRTIWDPYYYFAKDFSLHYPDLTVRIKYWSADCYDKGRATFKGGKCLYEKFGLYNWNKTRFEQILFSSIDLFHKLLSRNKMS